MTAIPKTLAAVASVLLLAGCFDGSSNSSSATGPSATVDFTGFVKDQFNRTSMTAEPAEVNELDLSFNDQNNPQAFDDQLR